MFYIIHGWIQMALGYRYILRCVSSFINDLIIKESVSRKYNKSTFNWVQKATNDLNETRLSKIIYQFREKKTKDFIFFPILQA